MTDGIAAIGFFQQRGQDMKPAHFTLAVTEQLSQGLRSHYVLQRRQSRGPGLGRASHQTTESACLDGRPGFNVSVILHKLKSPQGVLQSSSDYYTVCDTVMFLLNCSPETPRSESAECSLLVSGSHSTLLLADGL